MDNLILLLFAFLILCVYFLPTFCSRLNENAHEIAWINFLLGWIPFVWLVLLLAALLGKKEDKKTNFSKL